MGTRRGKAKFTTCQVVILLAGGIVTTVFVCIATLLGIDAMGLTNTPTLQAIEDNNIVTNPVIPAETPTFIGADRIKTMVDPTHTSTIDPNLPFTSTPTYISNVTRAPTFSPMPSSTAISTVTKMPQKKYVKSCACSGDLYNCSDFSSQYQAQQCYYYCYLLGYGDIHHLDSDRDGLACEN